MNDIILQYIDLDTGLSRVRGNKKLYRKMLDLFSAGGEYAALEEHMAANDYEKAASDAHAIKGVSGNLAMTVLFETSTQLLGELRESKCDPQTWQAYLSALEKTRLAVAELCAVLDAELA